MTILIDPNLPNIDPGRPADTGSVPSLPNPLTSSGTFEATKISQMYSFSPSVKPHHDTHKIGVRSTPIASASYRFRNNTVSTNLRVDFTLPTGSFTFSFLSVDLPLMPPDIINRPGGPIIGPLPPGATGFPRLYLSASEERTVKFSFNEEGAYSDILRGQQDINSSLVWNVTPINVSGPVYVYKNLPELKDPNEIVEDRPTTPIPIEGDLPLPEPKPVGTTDTHLYLSLSPANPRVPYRSTQTVELMAWVGDEFAAPNVVNAKKLTFAPGSLVWSPLSNNSLAIDPLDGSSTAIFRSMSVWRASYGRKTTFTVTIIKPPINMSLEMWDNLYRKGTGSTILLGDSNATRVPLPDGTLAYRLTGVATS